mmetsp:Transcript_32379/g.111995  ORF Transcript_32379/g.111995 Transcript_32379/m.111995 type:complete len:296 (+) Transcript_32379:904-1791(+)
MAVWVLQALVRRPVVPGPEPPVAQVARRGARRRRGVLNALAVAVVVDVDALVAMVADEALRVRRLLVRLPRPRRQRAVDAGGNVVRRAAEAVLGAVLGRRPRRALRRRVRRRHRRRHARRGGRRHGRRHARRDGGADDGRLDGEGAGGGDEFEGVVCLIIVRVRRAEAAAPCRDRRLELAREERPVDGGASDAVVDLEGNGFDVLAQLAPDLIRRKEVGVRRDVRRAVVRRVVGAVDVVDEGGVGDGGQRLAPKRGDAECGKVLTKVHAKGQKRRVRRGHRRRRRRGHRRRRTRG